MLEIAKYIWDKARFFGFSTSFSSLGVDAIEKNALADGRYDKQPEFPDAVNLLDHFDRVMIARPDRNSVVLNSTGLIQASIDNRFGTLFSVNNPQSVWVQHPIAVNVVEKSTDIPDDLVIQPHTASGPVSVQPINLYISFENDLIEFGGNLNYAGRRVRFGIDSIPFVLHHSPVDVLTERFGIESDNYRAPPRS